MLFCKEFHKNIISMIFIIQLSFNAVHLIKIQSTMVDLMLEDIANAFRTVTNETSTRLRKRIIPEMYNLTGNLNISFQIPNEKNDDGFSLLYFQRNEMMKPVFPNLTINQVEMKIQKRRSEISERSNEKINRQKLKMDSDIWSSLGLEGWTGELTQATALLETKHKDAIGFQHQDEIDSSGQSDKRQRVSYEIGNKTINNKFSLTKSLHTTSELSKNISDYVYIARANDPFGMSTKWAYRNDSMKNTKDDRQKRGLVELYSMIKCAAGCEPLTYQSYGCFCGFLGNGIAVDGIDKCCQAHDICYSQTNCASYLQYFVPYIWKCYHGKPICALSHGEFGGPTSCAALLCYCDVRLAICLRKFNCPRHKAVCRTSFSRQLQNLFL